LQRQLDLLGHDVKQLVESNKEFHQKIESLWVEAAEREYRLRNVEKAVAQGVAQ
jgi:cell division septum initiation protein DivIVA